MNDSEIKESIRRRQDEKKRLKENGLIFSTIRGKYGDRMARYMPDTEASASTIPTTDKWEGDAYDAITNAELEKLMRQEYAADDLAEQIGETVLDDMYRRGVMFGGEKAEGPLFVDKEDYYGNSWDEEQKRRRTAEKEKALKPSEIKGKEYPSKLEAFLFGYDPDSDGEEGLDIDVLDAGYAVPVLGSAMYGGTMLDQVRRGGMPGFIDAAIAVPVFGPGARKAGKSFAKGFRRGRARRFAKGMEGKDGKNLLDYARTQLFDREGNLVGEW